MPLKPLGLHPIEIDLDSGGNGRRNSAAQIIGGSGKIGKSGAVDFPAKMKLIEQA
jgi:hypothetical protein